MKLYLLIAAASVILSASGFTSPTRHVHRLSAPNQLKTMSIPPISSYLSFSKLNLSSDSDASSSSSRKRRKRKDGKQFTTTSSSTTDAETDLTEQKESASLPEPEETPPEPREQPKQNTVVMQVRDIRDVLSGDDTATTTPAAKTDAVNDNDDDDEELADDEEWEYYDDEDEEEFNTPTPVGGRTNDDSLEQLLADARRMRSSNSSGSNNGEMLQNEREQESSIKDKIFDAISTLVTIDFFVVIALLVWFLAGIFCSTVLGNDAVQIAFNMNFERVTQPALGILMIGSVAGALGNKEEDE
ncbi:hypothetical protein ACHAXS_011105 [Conticribra weissflogii]